MSWLHKLPGLGCCSVEVVVACVAGLLLLLHFLYPRAFLGGLLGGLRASAISSSSGNQRQRQRARRDAEGLEECKMVLCVRNDLAMGKGKIAAQCCHAALGAYRKVQQAVAGVEAWDRMEGPKGVPHPKLEAMQRQAEWLSRWEDAGEAKIVVKIPDAKAAMDVVKAAMLEGINAYCVHDAGRTQVPRGSMTAIAVGPAPASLVDNVTGHLKLL